MNHPQTIINILEMGNLPLSKSHNKLSKYIVSRPQEVIHLSIVELATRADVSVPTVNRFCHKLDCKGFPDFKLRLAQEISRSSKLYGETVDISDDTTMVMKKIMSSIQASVSSIIENTNPADIDKAASILSVCKSISVIGIGASVPVALDAQHRFLRLGIPVIVHSDYIFQRMLSATLNAYDAMIIISRTGRNDSLIECAKLAGSSNVPVIGLAPKGSPLSQYCSVVINAVTQEDTGTLTPMTSRIVHLVLIDLLTTVLALRKGETDNEYVERIKSNIARTRIE